MKFRRVVNDKLPKDEFQLKKKLGKIFQVQQLQKKFPFNLGNIKAIKKDNYCNVKQHNYK